jgi:hypothetical protein
MSFDEEFEALTRRTISVVTICRQLRRLGSSSNADPRLGCLAWGYHSVRQLRWLGERFLGQQAVMQVPGALTYAFCKRPFFPHTW